MKTIFKSKYNLFFLMFFILNLNTSLAEDTQINSFQFNRENIETERIQQFKQESEFKKEIQKQLYDWINQETNLIQNHIDFQPSQSIMFLLNPGVSSTYRIKSPNDQSKRIRILIGNIQKDGQLTFPENPQKQDYVQLFISSLKMKELKSLGKIYVQKIFQIDFHQKYINIHLNNSALKSKFIILDIQQQQIKIDISLKDDKFTLTKTKIETILKQTKATQINRQHLYKFQWGFYQKNKKHQIDMLGFTGAQLLIIIVTSIVQMYCIKNLVDSQLII